MLFSSRGALAKYAIEKAKEVLQVQYPECAEMDVRLSEPLDSATAQAYCAASLPRINARKPD